jgi:gliding motility-associated-like protein
MDINIIAKTMTPIYVTYVSMALMFYFLIVDLFWSQLASAMTPDLLRKWSEGEDSRKNVINQFLAIISIYSILTCFMCVGLKFFGGTIFTVVLGKSGNFQNILPILYYLLLGLPFMVGYAFFYRLFLLNNTSVKFMIFSLGFLSIKIILIALLYTILNYQSLVILSSLILLSVYLSFILFMSELLSFRKLMLLNFSKVLFVILLLVLFIIIFPNVFTPNGDKINDVFKFSNSNLKDLNCTIYDRWGLKLYQWTGVLGYWDGNVKSLPAPSGTYFYILNYTTVFGEVKTEKNFFSLFRD